MRAGVAESFTHNHSVFRRRKRPELKHCRQMFLMALALGMVKVRKLIVTLVVVPLAGPTLYTPCATRCAWKLFRRLIGVEALAA